MAKRKNNQNDEYAIEVMDVDKTFHIPDEKVDSFRQYFVQPWKLFTKSEKKFEALSDISFNIKKGEFVGIVGRNGSGKSTLLKLIAGIYQPDKGQIKVNGKLVPFLELGVGFNPDLSARENIFLNGTILGMSKKFLDRKADEILKFAGVTKFADTPIKNFSSGMTVRLAFAIAIQAKADIYLLDEVLAVGDDAFRRKSMKKIKELIKSGVTVLYVSHDLGTVEELTDRAIWINDSRVAMDGDPSEVVEEFQLSMLPEHERRNFLEARDKIVKVKHLSQFAKGRDVDKILDISSLIEDKGDGRATIESINILDDQGRDLENLSIDKKYSIKVRIKINGNIANPVLAIGIRKDINMPLFELNTPISKKKMIPSLKKGDILEVVFKTQNSLNIGIYHLLCFLNDPNKFNKGTGKMATRVDSYRMIKVTEDERSKEREWRGPIHIDYSTDIQVN